MFEWSLDRAPIASHLYSRCKDPSHKDHKNQIHSMTRSGKQCVAVKFLVMRAFAATVVRWGQVVR